MYNKEDNVTYTSLDKSPEVTLHDGTKVVFPINLDKSVCPGGSFVPPNFDSDGNKIREDLDKSGGSIGSIVLPVYNSEGHEIL